MLLSSAQRMRCLHVVAPFFLFSSWQNSINSLHAASYIPKKERKKRQIPSSISSSSFSVSIIYDVIAAVTRVKRKKCGEKIPYYFFSDSGIDGSKNNQISRGKMDWHYFRVQVKKGECHGQRKERSDGLIEINERDGRGIFFGLNPSVGWDTHRV